MKQYNDRIFRFFTFSHRMTQRGRSWHLYWLRGAVDVSATRVDWNSKALFASPGAHPLEPPSAV